MALVILGAALSAFEKLDLAGKESTLLSKTTPVCMICDVILLPEYCNTKKDGNIHMH
jgi:hypothetical protein